MEITSYNHHAKAPSFPEALVLNRRLPLSDRAFALIQSILAVSETWGFFVPIISISICRVDPSRVNLAAAHLTAPLPFPISCFPLLEIAMSRPASVVSLQAITIKNVVLRAQPWATGQWTKQR